MDSSFIEGCCFRNEKLTLMMNGKWYRYEHFPFFVFQKFIAAPSRGEFYNQFIKPLWDVVDQGEIKGDV